MKRHFLIALAASALLSATAAIAQTSTWTIDKSHSQANFQIRHMGVSDVRGTISNVTGTIEWDEKNPSKSAVSATLDANTISTSNDARDKHLKSPDFFDVAKYPTLTFKSTGVQVVGPGKLKIAGMLQLGGQTKPVVLDVDGPAGPHKGMGGKMVMGFSATTVIKRSDFNFGQKYTAPALGDEVTLTIDLEASK